MENVITERKRDILPEIGTTQEKMVKIIIVKNEVNLKAHVIIVGNTDTKMPTVGN